jgi:uncharacterized membrane protein YczE
VTRLFAVPPWHELRQRLPQLSLGLVLLGAAFGLTVRAGLGLDPWDVLHQGVSQHTGISIGKVSILVGVVILFAWIPLRQRLGIGTVANAVVLGTVQDLTLAALPAHPGLVLRWLLLLGGTALAGFGVALYVGARLGPGPRDGIMTGVAERGPSIRAVRTVIELFALAGGFLLGGNVGIGTVLFAVTIGPNVQFWLPRFDRGHPPGFDPTVDPEVDIDPTLAGG